MYTRSEKAINIFYKNLETIAEKCKEEKRIVVIFGMNKISELMIAYLKEIGVEVSFVIDNAVSKQGKKRYGLNIYSPDVLKDFNDEILVLIASSYQNEMMAQLESMGYKKDIHMVLVVNLKELMQDYNFADRSAMTELTEHELRKEMVRIVARVKEICEENNLRYYLAYGTLIGAVRHNGFIPWDDDIDLFIRIEDMKKMMDILKADEELSMVSAFDESDYYDTMGIIYSDKYVVDYNRFPMQFSAGVSIDIFPLFGVPEEKETAMKFYRGFEELELKKWNSLYDKARCQSICDEIYEYLCTYDFEKSKNVSTVIDGHIYEKEWFSEEKIFRFENLELPVPAGYDFVLKKDFGDYMELPPVEKRISYHYFKAYKENKRGIVIGASKDAIHTIEQAREQGVYVIALDGNEEAAGLKYADEAITVDISDFDKVCKIVEEIRPDFIIPIPIGRYLAATGYVNEKYCLPGIRYNATMWSTDKYLFHNKLKENGLRDVMLYLVNKDTSLEQLRIEYPAIMKPRYGSGSRDVFYLTSEEELKNAYEEVITLKEDFILEQAVEGIEYSVDGAVINGELKITLLRKKIITPLPVRQPIASCSVVEEEILNRVFSKLNRVIQTLEYNNCLLNADLIINTEDVFVIEIAPRPSGHNLHNVFVPKATGVDLAKEYIRYLLGKPYEFMAKTTKCVQIRFFDYCDVRVKKVPSLESLQNSGCCNLLEWNCNIREGDVLDKVVNGHSIMGRGFFIVEGKDEEDLIKQSEWVLKQFEVENV